MKIEKKVKDKDVQKNIGKVDFDVVQIDVEEVNFNDTQKEITPQVTLPYYSIQFTSEKYEDVAKKLFKNILAKHKEVRLEKLQYLYVIRLGKFKSYTQAKNIHKSLQEEFRNSIIVSVRSK